MYKKALSVAPKILLTTLGCSLPIEPGMVFLAPWSSLGISKAVMALQRTQAFLLLLLPSFVNEWFSVLVCFDCLLLIFPDSTLGFYYMVTMRLT